MTSMMIDNLRIMVVLTLVGQVVSNCQQGLTCCECTDGSRTYHNDIADCRNVTQEKTEHYKDFVSDFTCQEVTSTQVVPTTQTNVTSNYTVTTVNTTLSITDTIGSTTVTMTTSPTDAPANRWFVWRKCFRGCHSCIGPNEHDCTECSPWFSKEEQDIDTRATRYTTTPGVMTSAVKNNSPNNDTSAPYLNSTTTWSTSTRLSTSYNGSTTKHSITTVQTTSLPNTFKCVCTHFTYADNHGVEKCFQSCPPGTNPDNKKCVNVCPNGTRTIVDGSRIVCITECPGENVIKNGRCITEDECREEAENVIKNGRCITEDECREEADAYVKDGYCHLCSGSGILIGTTCISVLAIVLPVVAVAIVLIGLVVVAIVIVRRRRRSRNNGPYADMEGRQPESETRRGPQMPEYGNIETLKTIPQDIPRQHDEVLRYTRDPSQRIDQLTQQRHPSANQLLASDTGEDYGQPYIEMTNEPRQLDLSHVSPHGYVNEQRIDDEGTTGQPLYGNVDPEEDSNNIYGNLDPAERERAKRSFKKKQKRQKFAQNPPDFGGTYEAPVTTLDYGETYETPDAIASHAQDDFDQTYEEPGVTGGQDFDQTYEAPCDNSTLNAQMDYGQTYQNTDYPGTSGNCSKEDEFGQIYENHDNGAQVADDFGEIYANSDPTYQNLPFLSNQSNR